MFTDSMFMAYRKLIRVRWADECVDVYANKIRQLAGLAGFEGGGLERFMRLVFVTGFSNTILIKLQQVPNIETLTMGDLLVWARVLITGDQSLLSDQDVNVVLPAASIYVDGAKCSALAACWSSLVWIDASLGGEQ